MAALQEAGKLCIKLPVCCAGDLGRSTEYFELALNSMDRKIADLRRQGMLKPACKVGSVVTERTG